MRSLRQQFAAACLERFARACDVPAFRQELHDGSLLNPFLHTQFIVQEVIGKHSGAAIDAVDANAIAVAIGAN